MKDVIEIKVDGATIMCRQQAFTKKFCFYVKGHNKNIFVFESEIENSYSMAPAINKYLLKNLSKYKDALEKFKALKAFL